MWFNFVYIFYWYFRFIKMSENRFFFIRSFNVLMKIEFFFKMNKGLEIDSLIKIKYCDE